VISLLFAKGLAAYVEPTKDERDFAVNFCNLRGNFAISVKARFVSGIAEHFHLHALKRWIGDVNFMTAVGETRTIPEDLRTTYNNVKGKI
jgi:diadenosine tetraphosphate (Ap4A) HIT family hydrolase